MFLFKIKWFKGVWVCNFVFKLLKVLMSLSVVILFILFKSIGICNVLEIFMKCIKRVFLNVFFIKFCFNL